MVKTVLNIALAIKRLKLDLYVYFFQKWVPIEDFNGTKCTSFLLKDDELLEKYDEIWEKIKNNIKKEFASQPVYNENI